MSKFFWRKMNLFRKVKEFFQPMSAKDRAMHHALIALAYWRKALKEDPKQEGFKVVVAGTDTSVTLQ